VITGTVQQRSSLIAASIVLVVAVVAVVVNAGDDEVTVALPSPSATPTPAVTVEPVTATPDATESAATTPVGPVATKAPAGLGIAKQPKAGTYHFREKSDGKTSEATLAIADRGPGKQSEEQEGVRADVTWSDESKLIDKITFGAPPQGFECDFQPDLAELRFPLKIGAAWNTDGTCSAPPGISVDFSGRTRVTDLAKRTVDGTSVDAWRLVTKATIEFSTAQGSFDQSVDSDSYLAPAYGVYVYSVDKQSGTDPTTGERVNETSTKELVSLTPS
jgi:hypothetical protein